MKLYDTMTRSVREFKPRKPGTVSLYACGLTVYDEPHIGNWSSYIAWDILVRVLRDAGYTVNHVQNYTDVGHLVSDEDEGEDKLAKAAKEQRKTAWDIALHYIKRAELGTEDLNIIKPTHQPRATDYIPQQIDFVRTLEEKGFTYAIQNEGIYFDTSKLKDYGKLARLDIAGLQAGKRVDESGKKNPTDFALWKLTHANEKRDMEWKSPWGNGFPGWHLECSVMSRELLGDQIDIHTGGIDHIPVHHTNEIAQTEALTGKPFVNYWLHRNFIKVDGNKMSKSLKNFYTLDDLAEKGFTALDFRMLMLQSHYRTESNFSWKNLEAARNRRIVLQAFADLRFQSEGDFGSLGTDYFEKLSTQIRQALRDDLNTPEALSIISQAIDHVATFAHGGIHISNIDDFMQFLELLDGLFGMRLLDSKDITKSQREIINRRSQARCDNDFTLADSLREDLLKQGIELKDAGDITLWSRISG